MLPWIRVCTVLNSYLADLGDLALHPDPTAPSGQQDLHQAFQQICWVPSWVKVCCSTPSLCVWKFDIEYVSKRTTAKPNAGLRLEGNYHLGVASRFVQSIHKKLPDCIDTDPVRMAFSITKVTIEIKIVGCCLCISEHRLTIISGGRRQKRRACETSRRNDKQTPGCGEDDS